MKIVFGHPLYDRDRTVKVGFSWLTLFFWGLVPLFRGNLKCHPRRAPAARGGLVPLFRGNLKWFAIIGLSQLAAYLIGWGLVGEEWGSILLQIPLSIWFAWIFNEQHRVWLRRKGWTEKETPCE